MNFKKTFKLFLFIFMMFMFVGGVYAAPAQIYQSVNSPKDYPIQLSSGESHPYYYHGADDGKPLYCLNPELGSTTTQPYDLLVTYTLSESTKNNANLGYACAVLASIRNDNYSDASDGDNTIHEKLQKRLWEANLSDTCVDEFDAYTRKTCDHWEVDSTTTTEGTYSNFGIEKSSYPLSIVSNTSQFYRSELIKITATGEYTFDLSSFPAGTFLTTSANCSSTGEITSPSSEKNVYLCINSTKTFNSNLSYTLTINGTKTRTNTITQKKRRVCYGMDLTVNVSVYRLQGAQAPSQSSMQDFAYIETTDADTTKPETTTDSSQTSETQPATDSATVTIPVGEIKIFKRDEVTKKGIQGVTFVLYRMTGNTYNVVTQNALGETLNLVTNSTGHLNISNLPYGTYKIVERSTAPGYTDVNYFVEGITLDSETISMTIENEPITTIISKKAISGEDELPGAHIVIKNLSGETVHEFDSTEEPYEFILGPGKYKLTETAAPEGYEKLETVFEFEILGDGKVKLTSPTKSDNFESKDNKITLYNEPTVVDIPDTGKMNVLQYMLGLALAVIGSIMFVMFIRHNKIKNEI